MKDSLPPPRDLLGKGDLQAETNGEPLVCFWMNGHSSVIQTGCLTSGLSWSCASLDVDLEVEGGREYFMASILIDNGKISNERLRRSARSWEYPCPCRASDTVRGVNLTSSELLWRPFPLTAVYGHLFKLLVSQRENLRNQVLIYWGWGNSDTERLLKVLCLSW